ncbi:hypothetical protein [Pseudodesulfovibrio sediminis]|uniref:Uncharacterized protein n=1 Tax=Pseudodesulfovibrio sediminis TaxID=2810563 RepID=A0ABN6EPI2_9BACT|nr:hypothetical protein [Pseudodesulfovibrio sediminis]BCS87332.1 hypothetical protein PSDVSF_05740 [Pseudodesulfovibrio sediminis]
MAYNKENLRLVGGYPGDNLYIYSSDDAIATVITSDYFGDAENDYNLTAGDIIIAKTGDNAAADMLVVSGVSPATVVNAT